VLSRSTPLKRYPERPTKRHPLPKGPSLDVVRRVVERDEGRCRVCWDEVFGDRALNWSVHHRRGRTRRPDSNSPQNLILVCGADNVSECHGRIHQRRGESQPAGWWISRITGADPLTVPLLTENGSRWVYLGADYRVYDNPPLDSGEVKSL
jgi:hypothetical protein